MTDNYDCIIGIDPGAAGGLAMWTDSRLLTSPMPKDMAKVADFLDYAKDNYKKPIVFIEKINIRRDDLFGGKVFRIQHMIENLANLKAMISLSGLPMVEIHPATWQTRLRLRIAGEQKTDRKRRYKEIATSLCPQLKVTMKNCDAILIMLCGVQIVTSPSKKDMRWLEKNIVKNERASLI